MIKISVDIVSFLSDLLTILASGIAIWLFISKRDSFRIIFQVLINFSYQITLHELKYKLEKLNDLNAGDKVEFKEIVNIFSEITGQLRGNDKLKVHCQDIILQMAEYIDNPKSLTEPKKRSIIHELREKLRNVDIENFEDLLRG
jgi:hypothetical protein